MNDSFFVRRLERVGGLPRDLERAIHWKGSACKVLGEGRPFDQLHHQRAHTIGLFETVNRRDVWMVKRREETGFSFEACDPFGVGRRVAGRTSRRHHVPSRVSRAR